MSPSGQSATFYRHCCHYLDGVDPALGDLWRRMMKRAGYPGVSAAIALEAILADFQSGVLPPVEQQPGEAWTAAKKRAGWEPGDAARDASNAC